MLEKRQTEALERIAIALERLLGAYGQATVDVPPPQMEPAEPQEGDDG